MNRVDRLVAMVLHLQGRRVVRAEELAQTFEISERTVYRDIVALGEAGVPVVGEAGVGYSLARGYHLPPVMFTVDEALAMAVGQDLVKALTDDSIAGPMGDALVKIRSVLPADHQDALDRLRQATAVLSPQGKVVEKVRRRFLLGVQRAAIARAVLNIKYRDREGAATAREIEPLGVIYFNDAWYVVAWCRMRQGLRHFRVDRMEQIERTGEKYAVREDFTLAGHLESERHGGGVSFTAVVRMTPGAADCARSEQWLGVVKETVVSDSELELTFEVGSLESMAWWVVSQAGRAWVVSPAKLRRKVAEMAREVWEKHQDSKSS